MTFQSFDASAPGKVILSGEHAVVHGTHAVATVVDKRTFARFIPVTQGHEDDVSLTMFDTKWTWSLKELRDARDKIRAAYKESTGSELSLGTTDAELSLITDFLQKSDLLPAPKHQQRCELEEKDKALPQELIDKIHKEPAMVFMLFFTMYLDCAFGLHVIIRSDLPMGAGLGSSASLCAAMAAGVHALRIKADTSKPVQFSTKDREEINRWAFQGERVLHKTPSGVDNTCSVYGGVIVYRRTPQGQTVDFLPSGCIPKEIELLITDTKQPRTTSELVAGVRRMKEADPEGMAVKLAAFDQMALQWVTIIKAYLEAMEAKTNSTDSNDADADSDAASVKAANAFFQAVSEIVPENQALLNDIGVGHPTIDKVVEISKSFNLPSKLTGAGGGGCVLTLVPPMAAAEEKAKLLKEFEAAVTAVKYQLITTIMGQDGARATPV